MPSDPDGPLLAAWQAGDRRAGGLLFERHAAAIARFFRNKVTSTDDAADLVAQTFLACTEGKDRFRGETSVRRFLFAIAVNLLRAYIRKKHKRSAESVDFAAVCVSDLEPPSVSSIVARRHQSQRLVRALREIPIDFQVALELAIVEELSGREIAEILGIPEGTVRGRLRLGKHHLRRRLAALNREPGGASTPPNNLEGWAQEIRAGLGGADPRAETPPRAPPRPPLRPRIHAPDREARTPATVVQSRKPALRVQEPHGQDPLPRHHDHLPDVASPHEQ